MSCETLSTESFHHLHSSHKSSALYAVWGVSGIIMYCIQCIYIKKESIPACKNTYSSVVRALVRFAKVVGSNPTMYSLHIGFSENNSTNFETDVITSTLMTSSLPTSNMTSSLQPRWCHHFMVMFDRLTCLVRLYQLSHFTTCTHPKNLLPCMQYGECQELSCTAFSAYVSKIIYPSMQNTYSSVVRALVWFAKVVGLNPTMYSLHVGFSENNSTNFQTDVITSTLMTSSLPTS